MFALDAQLLSSIIALFGIIATAQILMAICCADAVVSLYAPPICKPLKLLKRRGDPHSIPANRDLEVFCRFTNYTHTHTHVLVLRHEIIADTSVEKKHPKCSKEAFNHLVIHK